MLAQRRASERQPTSCMHLRSAQAGICTIWSWTSSLARTSWPRCTTAEPEGPFGVGFARDRCAGGTELPAPARRRLTSFGGGPIAMLNLVKLRDPSTL